MATMPTFLKENLVLQLTRSARDGNPFSCLKLARHYHLNPVHHWPRLAHEFYEEAAKLQVAAAAVALGEAYEKGAKLKLNITKNHAEARKYYEAAISFPKTLKGVDQTADIELAKHRLANLGHNKSDHSHHASHKHTTRVDVEESNRNTDKPGLVIAVRM